MKKTIILATTLGLFISGCSVTSDKIHEPQRETISAKDIGIYQDIKDSICSVDRYKDDAQRTLAKTFKRISETQDNYEDRLDGDDSDRFSKVVKSFKKQTIWLQKKSAPSL